jgi:chromosome segregation ATPase
MVQNRRQEKIVAYENLQTFQDEMDALKLESIASSTSLERMKASLQMTEGEATEKMKQLHTFRTRYEEIKMRLDAEKEITASHEKTTQIAEERLKDREKELKTTEHQVQTLKQQMFKDSQILADLRQKESDLISEIRSTQVNTTRINPIASTKVISS